MVQTVWDLKGINFHFATSARTSCGKLITSVVVAVGVNLFLSTWSFLWTLNRQLLLLHFSSYFSLVPSDGFSLSALSCRVFSYSSASFSDKGTCNKCSLFAASWRGTPKCCFPSGKPRRLCDRVRTLFSFTCTKKKKCKFMCRICTKDAPFWEAWVDTDI